MVHDDDEIAQMRAAVNIAMEEVGADPLDTDDEGHHVFRDGCASGTIRVVENSPYTSLTEYHVVGIAVVGVTPSKELLEEINSINQTPNGATVYLENGTVYVARVIGPAKLGTLAITTALVGVGQLAARIGPSLAAVYGGETPHPFFPW
jgi:hypothetical protein